MEKEMYSKSGEEIELLGKCNLHILYTQGKGTVWEEIVRNNPWLVDPINYY